ncbi:MAG: Sugar ABC transporter, sugar-binding protein [Candidatus Woesebacteria bacterium]|nr:MAG: Sugar ABC transporter, sugar-binding protein [Candidatus Woesebacteria bacterium]
MNQDNNNNQSQVQGQVESSLPQTQGLPPVANPLNNINEPLVSAGVSGETSSLYVNSSQPNPFVPPQNLESQGQPVTNPFVVSTPDNSTSQNETLNVSEMKPESQPISAQSNPVLPPKPAKKFPLRLVLILLLVVAVVVGLIFAAGKFLGKKTVEEKNITWWNLWEDDSIIKPLIQEYEAKNPNVKINYVKQSPQDYRERLASTLAKGEGPDIFAFHNTWTPLFVRDLDGMPPQVMSSADMAQNYYYVISADLTFQGRILGIPLGYDALTLFINEDLFKEAGLNPPTTWVELRDDAKLLTKVVDGRIVQSGVALGRVENVDHWQEILALMMLQNGVNFAKSDPSLVENSLLFYTIFSRSDKVWDETLPSSTEAFAAGKLAMYFGPSWRAFNIKEINPNLNFRTVPLPQIPKENPDEPDISYATYWSQGVWIKSKNKDLAWDFLKFISSRDSLEKIFKQASLVRGFGEVYPRSDMANLLLDHPILGSVVKLAPDAKSWYLASRTFDGPTGINSQLSKYFEDAINALNDNQDSARASETLIQGINQVLTQYGLAK